MRLVINDKLAERRSRAAQRALTIGIMLLLSALGASFYPRYVLLAYPLMLLATILLTWATRTGDKWSGDSRSDKVLAKVLKGLDHRHRLYSYLLPAEHVLLSPAGIFVLKVKRQDGEISCHSGKWRRRFSLGRLLRMLSEEQLGNPTKQARLETGKLRRFVASHLPDVDVPIQPVIVFINPRAELDVVEPTMPAMLLSALKAYLRNAMADRKMPQERLKALIDLFSEQAV